MVNYRRILWETGVVCALLAFAASAPTADCDHNHYDQRQNGTDNIRVHVDGFVVAVVPAETMSAALAAAIPDLSSLIDEEDLLGFHKPKPPVSQSAQNQISPKPEEKPQEVPEKPLEVPEKPQSESEITVLEAGKPEADSSPSKSNETPISDVSLNSETVEDKKPMTNEQKKALRLKKIFGSLLVPFLRKTRIH